MLDGTQTAAEIVQERTLKALYRDSERETVTQTITEDAEGCWYFIRCAPGRDLTAFNWLSRRRFGVFLPMQGLKRVLPGWLCAYVWDMEAMQERILACPGVLGILRGHDHMPKRLTLDFIVRLANTAWAYHGKPIPAAPRADDKQSKKSKQRKSSKRDASKLKKLKHARKRAERSGELARAFDIQAQITALRQRLSAPRGVAA